MLRGAAIACLLVGMVFGGVGCLSQTCSDMGCSNGASIDGQIAAKSGDIIQVELCLDGQCAKRSTTVPTNGQCADVGGTAGYAGSVANASVCIEQGSASGTMQVSGELYLGPTPANDGDHYVVTFTNTATGTVVGQVDQHVQYSVLQPNGASCGPTCRQVDLTVAPP